jgi:agmatine/peptidylarginine deiminase
MKNWLWALSCMVLLTACDEQQEPLAPIPAGAEKAEIAKVKPMLPAWRTDDEKLLGKADQYSDYKDANPNTYGITNPPTVAIRPVAEYEPASIMLVTYTAGLSKNVAKTIAETVKFAADVVEVGVVVENATVKTEFTTVLKNAGMAQAKIDSKVTWYTIDNDSIWMRDYGPIPLVSNGKVALTDLRYYPNRIYDDAIPTKLGTQWNVTVYRAPLDYEGGNLMNDTKGTCFASQGLLWFNPVPQTAVEKYMKEYVGCVKTYYTEPLEDGTTHIDMYSKLTDDKTWVMGKCSSTYCSAKTIQTLDKNAAYLEQLGYKVYRIPMPNQKDGVWRTYTNSLFVNNSNLIPVYTINKDLEAEAMNVWKTAMPTWNHIGIISDEVITWGGAQHCVTMTIGVGAKSPIEAAPGFACDGAWDCYPGEVVQTDSCAGKCGGQSGACYCDNECFNYGDCCDDVCDQCPDLSGCGGTPTGCDGITYEGCCDGQMLKYCENDALKTIDCAGNPSCGWSTEGGFYDCGTNGAADPSGANPMECNGGGPCTPNCTGKVCGGDGCGGTCGNCPAGQTCQNGACVAGPAGCGNVTYEGCCEGETLKYCDNNQLQVIDCAQSPKCGWQPQGNFYDCNTQGTSDPSGKNPMPCSGTCTPNCTGKVCGDDGCGGSCGTCTGGKACQNGQCVGCTPSCTGKQCGDDGCGGLCGSCPVGQSCQNGQCVGCQPDCTGKVCGDDGCGGSCGNCPVGQTCKAGQCASGCTASCTGKTCGDDGCGGSCGNCAAGLECKNFQCVQPCVANCIGKACGDDGCGGSCGTCMAGLECNASNQCVQPCVANCVGKQCGDDGCGGLCGTCPNGLLCEANMCIAPPAEDLGGEEDVIEPGNDEDTGSGNEPLTPKKKSGGCSATGTSNHAGLLLLASMIALLGLRRRLA